jgi:flagellar protein FlbD
MGKDREDFYINPALIEIIEKKPDTIITLINGKKYIVGDTVEELLEKIQNYYKVAGLITPKVIFNSYDFTGVEDYLL